MIDVYKRQVEDIEPKVADENEITEKSLVYLIGKDVYKRQDKQTGERKA